MVKKSSKSNFNFDGCVICRAMSKADERGRDLSLSELREAFAKANQKKDSKANNPKREI